ncbi:hypothetical protein [Sideroxydans sp. CL21]|nr:hypothetical protein [Sideroxydans sp. CL21]
MAVQAAKANQKNDLGENPKSFLFWTGNPSLQGLINARKLNDE